VHLTSNDNYYLDKCVIDNKLQFMEMRHETSKEKCGKRTALANCIGVNKLICMNHARIKEHAELKKVFNAN